MNLLIDKIQKIVEPIIYGTSEVQNNFPVEFTFFHLLERTSISLHSIKVLFENDMLKNDHSIGLICRNIISDFITICYIVIKSESKDDHKYFYSLYRSDYNLMVKYIHLVEEYKLISSENLKELKLKLNEGLYSVIKTNSDLEHHKFPSTSSIIKEVLKEFNQHKFTQQLTEAYDIWILLSKYEHVGYHSYTLTRSLKLDELKLRILHTLKISSMLSAICLEELDEPSSAEIMRSLHNEIYCA